MLSMRFSLIFFFFMIRRPPRSTLFPTRRSSDLVDEVPYAIAVVRLREGVSLIGRVVDDPADRKSTRLNSSHVAISYAVFCLKKKKKNIYTSPTKPTEQSSYNSTPSTHLSNITKT